MAVSDNQMFIEQYAEIAMKHQVLYGIPASITLAQLCLETGFGKSYLFSQANNGFGIKVDNDWLNNDKPFVTAKDDNENDKFRKYNSVEASIDDHAKILLAKRYSSCYKNGALDFEHFAKELQSNGYATDKNYADKLIATIKQYNLNQYDQIALAYQPSNKQSQKQQLKFIEGHWVYPLIPNESGHIEILSHTGLQTETALKANYVSVLSTEDNGKVIQVGFDAEKGKFVSVSYQRENQGEYQVTFTHLDKVSVRKGDTLQAQSQIGISGETGQCQGPVLGMKVVQIKEENQIEIPTERYLAELSLRGHLTGTVMQGNQDLLAQYKEEFVLEEPPLQYNEYDIAKNDGNDLSSILNTNDPTSWLKYLAETKKDGPLLGQGDIISELLGLMISSMLALSSFFKKTEKQQEGATEEESTQIDSKMQDHVIIQRQREGIDGTKAAQLASLNFDSMTSEQQTAISQKLS